MILHEMSKILLSMFACCDDAALNPGSIAGRMVHRLSCAIGRNTQILALVKPVC